MVLLPLSFVPRDRQYYDHEDWRNGAFGNELIALASSSFMFYLVGVCTCQRVLLI